MDQYRLYDLLLVKTSAVLDPDGRGCAVPSADEWLVWGCVRGSLRVAKHKGVLLLDLIGTIAVLGCHRDRGGQCFSVVRQGLTWPPEVSGRKTARFFGFTNR